MKTQTLNAAKDIRQPAEMSQEVAFISKTLLAHTGSCQRGMKRVKSHQLETRAFKTKVHISCKVNSQDSPEQWIESGLILSCIWNANYSNKEVKKDKTAHFHTRTVLSSLILVYCYCIQPSVLYSDTHFNCSSLFRGTAE